MNKKKHSMRDELIDYIAGKVRDALKKYVGFPKAKPLKVGDVARANSFVQFHADGLRNNYNQATGAMNLEMLFVGTGALMVVLDLVKENQQAYVLDLETGRTGWINKEALTYYE